MARTVVTVLAAVALLTAQAAQAYQREWYQVDKASQIVAAPSIEVLQPRVRRSPLEENPEEVLSRVAPEWDNDQREAIFEDFDIPESKINKTINEGVTKHKEGVKNVQKDENKYYVSEPISYSSVWVDLDSLNASGAAQVYEHPMLSKSYRRAATIGLNFSFPFYGHDVKNITIATGGFLYTGQYVHSWLAATQYIAPLMANFDTSQHERAKIRYADNGTALIVEWANVHLQGGDGGQKIVLNQKPENITTTTTTTTTTPAPESDQDDDGGSSFGVSTRGSPDEFTFQAILTATGDIYFAYKSVPIVINSIEDAEHPVKVGLSDAYIIDRTIFFVRRKTIYEYHRVSLKNEAIASNTAIYFRALSTCNRKRSCEQCLADPDSKQLKCKWCGRLRLCSDGLDRNRQDWLSFGCDHHNVENSVECSAARERDEQFRREMQRKRQRSHMTRGRMDDFQETKSSKSLHAGLVSVLLVLFLLLLVAIWLCYAYFFPHTWSGQVLIKYRPTRWHWLRSEPRYTAASIHM